MSGLSSVELTAAQLRQIDRICDEFESACRQAIPPLADFLNRAPAGGRRALLVELATTELLYRQRQAGVAVGWDEFITKHSLLAVELRACQDEIEAALAEASAAKRPASAAPASDVQLATQQHEPLGLHIRCPHCCRPVELLADAPHDDVTCRECGSTFCLVERDGEPAAATPLRTIGRFELLSRLGVGGFGTVWKARDPELDRIVALKIPRRGQLRAEEAALFLREARAAAQLRHPNIVPVHEIGRSDDILYIVSDFVPGVTLASWLQAERRSIPEVAALAVTVADALHFAHERGIVHRDLKPSNIMVDSHGEPQIMDFGLAKRDTGEVTMTVDGQILGTAAYMSPEQAAGQGHWTDRRADIYSLGVVLFQMATGELPYRGQLDAQLAAKLRDDAPDPRSLNRRVPRDYATICLKCLERDPNARYATAAAVAAELRRFLAGEPIKARPLGSLQRAGRWAKRRPAAAAALGLAAILAVGGPIAAVTIDRQRRDLADKADELIGLLADEQRNKQAREHEIDALEAEFAALLGKNSGVVRPVQPWRQSLIEQIVDRNGRRDVARAAIEADLENSDHENGLAAAKRNWALGMLYTEIGKLPEAAAHLEAARISLKTLVDDNPSEALYQAALAECCQQLSAAVRNADDPEAAESAAAEARQLRQQLADRMATDAAAAIDLLAAHYETIPPETVRTDIAATLAVVPELTKRILQSWPVDADALYEAACRLTLRTPMLP